MATKLTLDVAPLFNLPFSDVVMARVLAASTAENIAVPDGAKYVLFSADGGFYAKVNGTAVIPAGDVTDGSAPILNPTMRTCAGVTNISVIASATRIVTAAFYI